jgi:hypothetical protein
VGVKAEKGGGQFLQRLEFLGRDVCLLVLREAVDEETVSADLEQDDRPKAAGLAAALAGYALFEDATAEIGVPLTRRHSLCRAQQFLAPQINLAGESRKPLVL